MAQPTIEPIIWRIMDEMRTTLQGITMANGYWFDVGTVVIGRISPVEGDQLPIASLLPIQDLPEAGPSSVLRRVFTCTLRLWIDTEAPQAPLHLARFMADVRKAIMADPRRNGLAENTLELAYAYWYQLKPRHWRVPISGSMCITRRVSRIAPCRRINRSVSAEIRKGVLTAESKIVFSSARTLAL